MLDDGEHGVRIRLAVFEPGVAGVGAELRFPATPAAVPGAGGPQEFVREVGLGDLLEAGAGEELGLLDAAGADG